MTLELTADEALMIVYALSEIADRRQEQAIDNKSDVFAESAENYRDLASRIRLVKRQSPKTT